ncbi:MAG: sensor histidine kinase [Mycoplasmatales bacterium]
MKTKYLFLLFTLIAVLITISNSELSIPIVLSSFVLVTTSIVLNKFQWIMVGFFLIVTFFLPDLLLFLYISTLAYALKSDAFLKSMVVIISSLTIYLALIGKINFQISFFMAIISVLIYYMYIFEQHVIKLQKEKLKQEEKIQKILAASQVYERTQKIYEYQVASQNMIEVLHDQVGHNLTSSLMLTRAIIASKNYDALVDLESELEQTYKNTREIINNKYERATREYLFNDLLKIIALEVEVIDLEIINSLTETDFILFVTSLKECLNNVKKHSDANQLKIKFNMYQSAIHISVSDNGTQSSTIKPNIGLQMIKNRHLENNADVQFEHLNGFKTKFIYRRKNV